MMKSRIIKIKRVMMQLLLILLFTMIMLAVSMVGSNEYENEHENEHKNEYKKQYQQHQNILFEPTSKPSIDFISYKSTAPQITPVQAPYSIIASFDPIHPIPYHSLSPTSNPTPEVTSEVTSDVTSVASSADNNSNDSLFQLYYPTLSSIYPQSISVNEFNYTIAHTAATLCGDSYCNYQTYLTKEYIGYAMGFIPLKEFRDPNTDLQGYIGVMKSQQTIYLIFRGSDSILNWIENLDAILTTYPYCSECQVHQGFYRSEQAAYDNIVNLLSDVIQLYPKYRLIVTGHSLGGALATLLSVDLTLKEQLTNFTLITFGSPRVGNQQWASFASDLLYDKARVTHHKDIVPHLPTHTLYTHISSEWYEDGNHKLKKCNGYEDYKCSYQWYFTDVNDHQCSLSVCMVCT